MFLYSLFSFIFIITIFIILILQIDPLINYEFNLLAFFLYLYHPWLHSHEISFQASLSNL